jgi:transcriptional regulator GlxA family with amidase domain
MPRNLAILIFDDAEVLDFCGPLEVFSAVNRFEPAFNVFTVAEKSPVMAKGGLSVNPQYRLTECPRPDILLVPGGQGTRAEMHNAGLIEWIRGVAGSGHPATTNDPATTGQRAAAAELVLSVCTGALLLAKAGLLEGLEATTHHGALELLRDVAPRTKVHTDRRFVDNGRVICAAGIAAGIDMSLYVVGKLLGSEIARQTAAYMEYPWNVSVPGSALGPQ